MYSNSKPNLSNVNSILVEQLPASICIYTLYGQPFLQQQHQLRQVNPNLLKNFRIKIKNERVKVKLEETFF